MSFSPERELPLRTEHILPRHLSAELKDALTYSRVVNVVGARQVGKTTLVRDILQAGRFISLDDDAVLEAIEADPWGQLQRLASETGASPLIIDEAQRSPRLPLAIKRVVDLHDRKGQFVLTGSSNVFTTRHVADSLAGRVVTLTLWPLTIAETEYRTPSRILDWAAVEAPDIAALPDSEPVTRDDYIECVLQGGFPEIRDLDARRRQLRYRQYVDSIIDRDVTDILRIRKSEALKRLINQLAIRTGTELNLTELGKLVGVQRVTMEQYLDLLTRLSLVIRLGAWSSGEHRREIKNAKHHFADTGIACALRGLTKRSFDIEANPSALGGLVESFVFSELLRSSPYQRNDFRFYHWRDRRGREIDMLVECDNGMVAVEVKASTMVGLQDFRHQRWFATEGPGQNRRVNSIIFYLGEHKLRFGERMFALPVSCLWSQPKN